MSRWDIWSHFVRFSAVWRWFSSEGALSGAYCPPPPTPCPTDTNNDGVTNVLDLIDLLLCFGQPGNPPCGAADVNNDGTVNVLDLIELLLAFGTACP